MKKEVYEVSFLFKCEGGVKVKRAMFMLYLDVPRIYFTEQEWENGINRAYCIVAKSRVGWVDFVVKLRKCFPKITQRNVDNHKRKDIFDLQLFSHDDNGEYCKIKKTVFFTVANLEEYNGVLSYPFTKKIKNVGVIDGRFFISRSFFQNANYGKFKSKHKYAKSYRGVSIVVTRRKR